MTTFGELNDVRFIPVQKGYEQIIDDIRLGIEYLRHGSAAFMPVEKYEVIIEIRPLFLSLYGVAVHGHMQTGHMALTLDEAERVASEIADTYECSWMNPKIVHVDRRFQK